jgi:hypothetical protein
MELEKDLKATTTGVMHLYEVRRLLKHNAMTSISSIEHPKETMIITTRTPSQIRDILHILDK